MTTENDHPDDEPTAADQIAEAGSQPQPGDPAVQDQVFSVGEELSRDLD